MAKKQTGFFATIGRILGLISQLVEILSNSLRGMDNSINDGMYIMNTVTGDVKKDFETDSIVSDAEREIRTAKAMARAERIIEKAKKKELARQEEAVS